MNPTPPVRLTLEKVIVRVIQLPLRRPIVAKLGEFKNFPFILTDVRTKEGVIGRSTSPSGRGPSIAEQMAAA
jgi:hypothetical protein